MTSAVWKAARKAALTKHEAATDLANRPYDLRHARITTWLNAGVDAAQVAEWAGHSVGVLMRVYGGCIVGRDKLARKRIEEAFEAEQDSPDDNEGGSPGPTWGPDLSP